MNIDEILEEILKLSSSQGFYVDLYKHFMIIKNGDPEAWEELVKELESQSFRDTLDIVLYFEQ